MAPVRRGQVRSEAVAARRAAHETYLRQRAAEQAEYVRRGRAASHGYARTVLAAAERSGVDGSIAAAVAALRAALAAGASVGGCLADLFPLAPWCFGVAADEPANPEAA